MWFSEFFRQNTLECLHDDGISQKQRLAIKSHEILCKHNVLCEKRPKNSVFDKFGWETVKRLSKTKTVRESKPGRGNN